MKNAPRQVADNAGSDASLLDRLVFGNRAYISIADGKLMEDTAKNGQHPHAVVICCSDSRVIPERIFNADIGELFVIRVAGNVLDNHQLGSVEYAAAHLGCKLIVMLGHTGCGAVDAALGGHGGGFISYILEDILEAVGGERDPDRACRLNVLHGVERIREEFARHPDIADIYVRGAVYNIFDGSVEWL